MVPRRREKSVPELLAHAPWWVSASLAVAVFIAAKYFFPLIHFESPVFTALNVLVGMSQQHAPYVALPFAVLAIIAASNRHFRKQLLDNQADIESIRGLSWQDFEILIGESFRRQGYSVEENTGCGADGGIDLRLRKNGEYFIVQCKRWRTKRIGVSPVRELFGLKAAERAHGAIFVASGTFTEAAKRFAHENSITLIDGHALAADIRMVGGPNVQVDQPRDTHLARH